MEYNGEVHQVFIEFKKAYDSVKLIKMCLDECLDRQTFVWYT
jgi:hypothetical protein